jgi:biopolymer transport protein ExbB/TolQ
MTTVSSVRGQARPRNTLAAFILGLPLAAGILYLMHFGPLRDTPARRYVSHPVECVEVVLFSCALGALLAKLWTYRTERRACRTEVLPRWDGQPVAVEKAAHLLAELDQVPRRLHGTFLVRRVAAVLDFLCSRGSAAELDDHLRTLADNDSIALEGSYSLIRFITWAIPILGFLGTVLGITGAISGVTPEVLEKSLSTVTDGLALAFDATALALGLTMISMFLTFLVDRCEQGVLEAVDGYADRQLAHRFQRDAVKGEAFAEVVRQQTQVLVQGTEQLVQRQAAVWAQTLEETSRRQAQAEEHAQQHFTLALETALERTLQTHAHRLDAMEKQAATQAGEMADRLAKLATTVRDTGREQQAALAKVAQAVAAQTEALARLQDGEKQLLRLQEVLHQNLRAVAGTGAFEEAIHSLTAAVHLLTARSTPAVVSGPWAGAAKEASGPRLAASHRPAATDREAAA